MRNFEFQAAADHAPATLGQKFTAWTDGACEPNPGRGGWGVRLESDNGAPVEAYGSDGDTTNNRMELQAAIEALKRTPACSTVSVMTDSQYVANGINFWRMKWQKLGWRRGKNARDEVKNADLWAELSALCDARTVRAVWVKGHTGIPGNERADALANLGRMNA
jgi:ribonuclease HI